LTDFIYTPDSRHIIYLGTQGQVLTLDSVSLEILREYNVGIETTNVEISRDGQVILVGGDRAVLLGFYSLQVITEFSQAQGFAKFSADNSVIIVGNESTIQIFTTCTQQQLISKPINQFPTSTNFAHSPLKIEDMEIAPNGRFIILTLNDQTIRYWGIYDDNSVSITSDTVATDCVITPTPTPTSTLTPSQTSTITLTPTITATATTTFTPTNTVTPTITPTPTFTFTPTSTSTALPLACQDAPIPRLLGNTQGRVLDDDPSPINMRDGAGSRFNRILEVPAGAFFSIIQGPICEGGYFWYQVNYAGTVGWIAEGDSFSYYTEPVVSG
jgi:WD40 repeat protein